MRNLNIKDCRIGDIIYNGNTKIQSTAIELDGNRIIVSGNKIIDNIPYGLITVTFRTNDKVFIEE